MRAAIYCRISKDDDGRRLGVQRQEADCRALCARQGWTVDDDDVFIDNDKASKANVQRERFDAMVDVIRSGDVKALVVYHPDRLTRRPVELESLIDLIEETRVKVATVSAGDYDLSNASGRMVARMLGAAARAEVERMGERMRSKKKQLAQAGLPLGGGRRSYGFTRDGLRVVEAEVAVLREAAASILAGESLNGATLRLNSAGTVPDSGSWSRTALRSALTSHRVAGLSIHLGNVTPAQWPAILDERTWLAMRDLRRARPNTWGTHLLTGVAFCECGGPMYFHRNRRKGAAYTCVTTSGGCGGCSIQAEPLEIYVLEQVERTLPRIAAAAEAAHAPTPDLDAADRAVDAAEATLADWTRKHLAGELDPVEWDTAAAELRGRLAKLRTDRTRAIGSYHREPVTAASVVEEWADTDARNGWLRRYVVVTVERCGRGTRTPPRARVKVEPRR